MSLTTKLQLRYKRSLRMFAVALCFTMQSGPAVSAETDSIVITQAVYDTYGRIVLSWSGPAGWPGNTGLYYFVYVVPGTKLTGSGGSWINVLGGRTFIYRPISAGAYTLAVKACETQDYTALPPSCTGISAPTTLNAITLPAAKFITLPFPHTASGDCELDSATVTFWSNGSGVFKGRVKTNHTRSGDVWHATIAAANAAKQDVVRLSTFDSTRMSDDHGYYLWTQTFEYDPTKFGEIASVNMLARC